MPADKKLIEVLTYKVDSFDNDSFIDDVKNFSLNSIILLFNSYRAWIEYKPEGLRLSKQLLEFIKFKNPRIDYLLYPFTFMIEKLRLAAMFLKILIRYDVRTVVVENTYAAAILAVFRKLNLFKRLVYLPGDWLAGCKGERQGIWSNIGSNSIFPFFDYIACRGSDVVLNCTERITKEREGFWHKKICKYETEFQNRLTIKQNNANTKANRNKILFMGKIRKDSGMELIMEALAAIKLKNPEIGLKMFGPVNKQRDYVEKLAKKYGVENAVELKGYIERDKFAEMMADCFCGINLITSADSYTAKTLPAKVFDYLQYLLPVIVTKNLGKTSELIDEFRLGKVIDADAGQLIRSTKQIYDSQEVYRDNILKYIKETAGRGAITQFF